MIIATVVIAIANVVLVAILQWKENENLFKIALIGYLSEFLNSSLESYMKVTKENLITIYTLLRYCLEGKELIFFFWEEAVLLRLRAWG